MNPNELRASIPALEEVVYLNTGASAPLPRPVAEAVQSCVTEQGYRAPTEEGMYTYAFEVYDEARRAAADLLGAGESEVALTQSTTDGINRIACASEWESGDVVVTTDSLVPVPSVFETTSGTRRRVRENLGWAFLYNGIAVPLAVAGVLNPLFAAIAMATSSLLVVLNSTRSVSDRVDSNP